MNGVIEPYVYIPYEGPEEDEEPNGMTMPIDEEEYDIPCGSKLRYNAFQHVWESYNQKLREVLDDMYATVVAEATDAVLTAYSNVSPLLLHTELPVVAISGPDRRGTATICAKLLSALSSPQHSPVQDEGQCREDSMSVDQPEEVRALVSSIGSSHCVNLSLAMKALIAGFMKRYPIENDDSVEAQKRRKGATSSLAPYDINMLDAWFSEYRKVHDLQKLKLVVFINEFEEAEPSVIQDLFYTCSLYIANLPIVFVLALASPKEPSFLHAVYPRKTLALLELRRIAFTTGTMSLQSLLMKLLYDPSFEPSVYLGPSAVDLLVEQYVRNSGSFEILSGLVKLILLQHFAEPLTVFAEEENLGEDNLEDTCEVLANEKSNSFVRVLLGRLYHPEKSTLLLPKRKGAWTVETARDILETVRDLKASQLKEARKRRVGLQVFLLTRNFMSERGYKAAADGKEDWNILGMMSACMRGGAAVVKEGNLTYLTKMIRKLSETQLKDFLQELYQFFFNQPRVIREEHTDAITPRFAKWMARLENLGSSVDDEEDSLTNDADHSSIARDVGDWILQFFDESFQEYTEINLWDIWYTGNPALITELMNPAPRVNVIGALLHPRRYFEDEIAEDQQEQLSRPVSDTSLLFERYLESGRMINVYDWYESFAAALDADRGEQRIDEEPVAEVTPRRRGVSGRGSRASPSPTKETKRKGKAKEAERVTETGTSGRKRGRKRAADPGSEDETDEEAWKVELHVRFLRGVQELDFMGLVKHTKRRAEHVLKTVFEPSV